MRRSGTETTSICHPHEKIRQRGVTAVEAAASPAPRPRVRDRPFEFDRFEIEGGQGVAGLAADLGG